MTFGRRWLRRPQSLWLRKALFQIHLWTALGVGLYVVLISVTGSVLVFRPELSRAFWAEPMVVVGSGNRMSLEELKAAAQRAYPGHKVTQVWPGKNPDQAVDIQLERDRKRKQRLFHPYTGEDLGDSVPRGFRFVTWLLDLHDNLLFGTTGRTVNGVGALLITLLSVTGAFIWWPGIHTWRRSLTVQWTLNWKRLTWNLHSAMGFWAVAFVFMWGISGVYLGIPAPFGAVLDFLDPFDESSLEPRVGDTILFWLSRLHFGRFAGLPVKVLWAVLGLAPPCLFVTGAVMWWNRVLRPPEQPVRAQDSQPSF